MDEYSYLETAQQVGVLQQFTFQHFVISFFAKPTIAFDYFFLLSDLVRQDLAYAKQPNKEMLNQVLNQVNQTGQVRQMLGIVVVLDLCWLDLLNFKYAT